jgi:hypothetical protein
VKRLRIIVVCVGCIASVGCGGSFFVGFVSNPTGSTSVTGTVTAVSSGFTSGPTGTTSLTIVTFVNSGTSITLYFCGDQHALLPINQTVRAEYTAGIACALLTRVVVMG